jgi:hypothetical protein
LNRARNTSCLPHRVAVLDTDPAGVGWRTSEFKGVNPGHYNIFDIRDGRNDGGYECLAGTR